MIYTLENKHLKVDFSDLGAEMQSLYGKTTSFEYLWQGNPEFWKGRAPILFPICGRLIEGKYTYKGKEYEMTIHGFIKLSTLTVTKKTNKTIVFNLKSNEETYKIYPFDFDFSMQYTLKGNKLVNKFIVKNIGDKDLFFSFGGHPGFNVPLCEGTRFDEYYIDFGKPKKCEILALSETCFYTGRNKDFDLKDDRYLPLTHSMFDNDAIFLENMTNSVTLKCDKTERFVKVDYKGMTHLGFWHKPKTEAPYVCIEPWHGVPSIDGKVDDFESKLEMIKLSPKKTYKAEFSITVNE